MILTFYNSVYYVSSYVIEYITPHITKATRFCPRRFSLFCIFTFIFFHELHFFISTVSSGCCSRSDLHPAPAAPDCYGSHDHHAYVQSYDPQEPSCQHIRGIVHAKIYAARSYKQHRHCQQYSQRIGLSSVLYIPADLADQYAVDEHAGYGVTAGE